MELCFDKLVEELSIENEVVTEVDSLHMVEGDGNFAVEQVAELDVPLEEKTGCLAGENYSGMEVEAVHHMETGLFVVDRWVGCILESGMAVEALNMKSDVVKEAGSSHKLVDELAVLGNER